MKKKLLYLTILIFLCFFSVQILTHTSLTIETVEEALSLWREKLFPSLFPFLVLGETLILMGFPSYLSWILEKPFQFCFHLSGQAIFIFLMSMISGFPSGPKYTCQLYREKALSKEEGNRLLEVVHFSNPLFILGTVFLLLHDKKVIFSILLATYLSNFIVLFLTRKQSCSSSKKTSSIKDLFHEQTEKFSSSLLAFLDCIQDGLNTMFFMLGSITFFMLASKFLVSFCPHFIFKVILTGFLDLTSGINMLGKTSISLFSKGLLATFFLSFGGCSVHIQVLNALKKSDLSYQSFLKGRLKATFFALLLFLFFYGV